MDIYICMICGHSYDPSKGEPLQNIPPGISFEQLPADWQCPVCCSEKKLFKKA